VAIALKVDHGLKAVKDNIAAAGGGKISTAS